VNVLRFGGEYHRLFDDPIAISSSFSANSAGAWPQNSLVALDCEARIVRRAAGFGESELPSG